MPIANSSISAAHQNPRPQVPAPPIPSAGSNDSRVANRLLSRPTLWPRAAAGQDRTACTHRGVTAMAAIGVLPAMRSASANSRTAADTNWTATAGSATCSVGSGRHSQRTGSGSDGAAVPPTAAIRAYKSASSRQSPRSSAGGQTRKVVHTTCHHSHSVDTNAAPPVAELVFSLRHVAPANRPRVATRRRPVPPPLSGTGQLLASWILHQVKVRQDLMTPYVPKGGVSASWFLGLLAAPELLSRVGRTSHP